ncbi:MAG: hypothetical protein H6925_05080 [Holosporaceae bacterium]|nr:MAG: hypothetical protein H6925_05080 [Holosporaceae bacterium]
MKQKQKQQPLILTMKMRIEVFARTRNSAYQEKKFPYEIRKFWISHKKGYSQSRIVTALEMEYPEITKEIVCSSYRRSHITNPTQPPQKNMTEEDRNAIWDAAMDMKEEGNQVNYKK